MTEAEFASLKIGDEVVVNPVELMSECDRRRFPNDMQNFVGGTYRVHSRPLPTSVRLMDEYGNDTSWYWYPTMISKLEEMEPMEPLPESVLKSLIYGI